MKAALIILVHESVPNTVKTGKITDISEQESIAIRRQLLLHTQKVTAALSIDKFVFLKDSPADHELWNKNNFIKRIQRGRTTSEIMQHAFDNVLGMGYKKVVMIGSDCIEMESAHLSEAFNHLDNYDVVIGPAHENGYYLLGLKKMYPSLFKSKSWSSKLLLQQTLEEIIFCGLSYHLQQPLNGVEEEKEIYLLQHRQ